MSHISPKNLTLSLLLLGALAVSAWLARQSFLSSNDDNTSQPTTPNAFMTEARYMHFNADGAWSSRIYSPRAIHYPEQDTTIFDKPRMTAKTEGQLTWVITADHGDSHPGLKVLYLTDNVHVQRIDDTTHKIINLTTTALTLYPPQKLAHTDQPVTIIQPGSTINAVGLSADLNKGELQLLSQVHGTYEKSTP